MSASDKSFTGSIPEIYERLLVPMIFAPYARDLADRLAELSPATLLETAAGTGALTRALASRLPETTRIVATDLNQPMLDRAATSSSMADRVVWKQADALSLPFPDQSFDAVACQFGVMFFPDKVQGYKEAHRVLRPGGTFIFNVWDRIAENSFAETVTVALATVFPHDPPTFMARTPHGYHDAQLVRSQLADAGFSTVSFETVAATSHAATARDTATAFCQGTPLRNEIESRDRSRLDEATRASTDALAKRFGNGPIEGRIKAHVFMAQR